MGKHIDRWRALGSTAALLVAAGPARAADPGIIWQNGFESADACAWTSTVPAVPCDPQMVFVPDGKFTMGSDWDPVDYPDEMPVHTPHLSAYWIDRNDVSVNDYAACVDAGVCLPPNSSYSSNATCNWDAPNRGAHPVNCIDWNHADAYCAWVGKRLPTEAEWEKAARGVDARTYPWGEATPTCDFAVMSDPDAGGDGCGKGSTWPVGSKPAGVSPYGALDMAGNVFQWVSDWYSPTYYAKGPGRDPQGPATGTETILRGGSFLNTQHLRSSYRHVIGGRSTWDDGGGFRCARSGD